MHKHLKSFHKHVAGVTISLAAFLAVANAQGQETLPTEPSNFREGVVRAWNFTKDQSPAPSGVMKTTFGIGDVLVVEVKNFNGWVISKTDVLGYTEEDLLEGASDSLKNIIRNGRLKLACDARLVIKDAANGALPSSKAAFVTTRVLDQDDLAVIQQASKLPAPNDATGKPLSRHPLAGGGDIAYQDAVQAVLDLPTFQTLKRLLPDTSQQQIAVLFEEVTMFVQKLVLRKASECRLRFNDLVIDGITAQDPERAKVTSAERASAKGEDNDYFWFHFPLDENPLNTQAWDQLRRRSFFDDEIGITLNCAFGGVQFAMKSAITAPVPGKMNPGSSTAKLILIRAPLFWIAVGVLLLALGIFAASAGRTDLIRDPQAGVRSDGLLPFSLSRSQMAFWFLLVVASSLFLWVSQAKLPVLNETCLWLIGIGAGTAIGAAAMGSGSDPAPAAAKSTWLARQRHEKRTAFATRLTALVNQLPADIAAASEADRPALQEQLVALTAQLECFRNQPESKLRRLLDDWLTEENRYSFHRYQMLVWTLVLGVIFIFNVWRTRSLPVFDGTLLALLGITNGTYLGFGAKK